MKEDRLLRKNETLKLIRTAINRVKFLDLSAFFHGLPARLVCRLQNRFAVSRRAAPLCPLPILRECDPCVVVQICNIE